MNITSALNDTLYTPREDILFTDALMILSRGVASRSGRVKVLFFFFVVVGVGNRPSVRRRMADQAIEGGGVRGTQRQGVHLSPSRWRAGSTGSSVVWMRTDRASDVG